MSAPPASRDPSVLFLEGEMTIYRAVELHQALLVQLEQRQIIEVDLSGVSELDTAGVQLLLFAKQVARARNKTLRLRGHSPAVAEVFELLNLAWYFGDSPAHEVTAAEAP